MCAVVAAVAREDSGGVPWSRRQGIGYLQATASTETLAVQIPEENEVLLKRHWGEQYMDDLESVDVVDQVGNGFMIVQAGRYSKSSFRRGAAGR